MWGSNLLLKFSNSLGRPLHITRKKSESLKYDDIAIAALWDISDSQRMDRELYRVRQGILHPDTFEHKLLRYYNDQTVYFDSENTRLFEPLELTDPYDNETTTFNPIAQTDPKHDLVTNSGLVAIAQLVTGKRTNYFTFFAAGTGTAIERPSDVRLSAETLRVSMPSTGYVDAVGTTMKFAAKFPPFMNTATITEGAVFDLCNPNSGVMLFRTVYSQGAKVEHIQNRTFFSLLQTINQISVS